MGHKYTLFFAAKEGRENDLLWVLNEKRISPDLREGESQTTPLHLTCARGHAKCAEILLKAGAKVNCRTTDGMTPLHFATYSGHLECIKVLLKYKADVYGTTRFGSTALHQAAYFGRRHCAKYLIRHGAPVNAQENWGLTPLAVALQKGDCEMVKLLLANRGSVKLCDKLDGKSPLHIACENKFFDCMIALLDAGADPNVQDKGGDTPLHIVLRTNQAEQFAPVLLEYGADPCLENKSHVTPLDMLCSSDVDRHMHGACKELLRQMAEHYEENPRSLMQQCKIAIRRNLGPNGTDSINELPLPESLLSFLRTL